MSRLSTAAGSVPRVHGSAYFFADWRIAAVQATGEGHIRDGTPCQDAMLYGEIGPVLWCAIADGVSTERMSQYGAKLAVEAVGEFLASRGKELEGWTGQDLEDAAPLIVQHCRARIVATAVQELVEDREFATTLQAMIIHRTAGLALYLSVGDGHCLVVDGEQSVYVLGLGRKSPDVGAATLGFADYDQYFHGELLDLAGIQSLLLFTDGLDRLFVLPRVKEANAAAPAENVAKVTELLLNADSEIDAVSTFGKIITNKKYRDQLSDDKSLLVLARDAAGLLPLAYPVTPIIPHGIEVIVPSDVEPPLIKGLPLTKQGAGPPPDTTPAEPESPRPKRKRPDLAGIPVPYAVAALGLAVVVAVMQSGAMSGVLTAIGTLKPAEKPVVTEIAQAGLDKAALRKAAAAKAAKDAADKASKDAADKAAADKAAADKALKEAADKEAAAKAAKDAADKEAADKAAAAKARKDAADKAAAAKARKDAADKAAAAKAAKDAADKEAAAKAAKEAADKEAAAKAAKEAADKEAAAKAAKEAADKAARDAAKNGPAATPGGKKTKHRGSRPQ